MDTMQDSKTQHHKFDTKANLGGVVYLMRDSHGLIFTSFLKAHVEFDNTSESLDQYMPVGYSEILSGKLSSSTHGQATLLMLGEVAIARIYVGNVRGIFPWVVSCQVDDVDYTVEFVMPASVVGIPEEELFELIPVFSGVFLNIHQDILIGATQCLH